MMQKKQTSSRSRSSRSSRSSKSSKSSQSSRSSLKIGASVSSVIILITLYLLGGTNIINKFVNNDNAITTSNTTCPKNQLQNENATTSKKESAYLHAATLLDPIEENSTSHKLILFHHHKKKYSSSNYPDPVGGCRVYLAQSSIPNAGLGIYSGVNLSKNEHLTESDIPILVTDLSSHVGADDPDLDNNWLLEEYYWGSITTVPAMLEAHSLHVALPSFGMAGNAHLGLWNVDSIENDLTNLKLDRGKHPNAGAVSEYPTHSWFAAKPILEGSEIFLHYGDNYFLTREESYGKLPLEEHFQKADEIVQKFHDILVNEPNCTQETKQQLWDLFIERAEERIQSALPKNASDLESAVQQGTALHSQPDAIRPMEWLEQHGQCMDNLYVKSSTIPHAGRGAFARTFIPKGSLVAPAPLIQILNRTYLNMYELVLNDFNEMVRKNDDVIGQQLLLNYCFGHANSSLLLFPYSTAVQFINHHRDNVNTEIRWSDSSFHRSDWLTTPIEEMTVEHSGLMFDFVATKDIYPGDEVFLNYGRDWEDAWNQHIATWEPSDDFVDPDVLNRNWNNPVLTLEEQHYNPYPNNIQTICYYYRYTSNIEIQQQNDDSDRTKVEVEWDYYKEATLELKYHRPCDILDREYKEMNDGNMSFFYTAQMFNHDGNLNEDYIPVNEEHIVYNVPHTAILFANGKYKSNMFLKNAFRHMIGVPEGMYPDVWMNDVVKE